MSYKIFVKYIHCFYDISLSAVNSITGLSYKRIDKAREEQGGGKKGAWPFTAIRRGCCQHHTWKSVNDARDAAIAVAPSSVRSVLWDVRRAAEVMRIQALTPIQRIWVEHRTVNYLTALETQEAMRNMVDLPMAVAMKILKAPSCMFSQIMHDTGLTEWPYARIMEGNSDVTMEEVALRRRYVISQLPDESPVKLLLHTAETVKESLTFVSSKEEKEEEERCATPPLFTADEPAPSAPEQPAEEEDSWFWGTDTELSPRSREYWDSLAELTQESFA